MKQTNKPKKHTQHNSMPASPMLSASIQLNLSQRDELELQQLRYGNDGGAASNENPVSMVEVVTILHTVPEVSGGGGGESSLAPFNNNNHRPMFSSFIAGGGGGGSNNSGGGSGLDDVGGSFASAMHDEQIQQRRWSQHRPSTSSTSLVMKRNK